MSDTREAAKRLCRQLDRLGVTALPYRSGKIVVKQGHEEQAVVLRPTGEAGEGGHHWFWVWEIGGEPFLDKGLKLAEEAELARRLAEILSLPDFGRVKP